MPNLGGWEWVIIALIALLLFGGSRLAGIGKNAGRAVRDFKDETKTLRFAASPSEPVAATPGTPVTPASPAEPGPEEKP